MKRGLLIFCLSLFASLEATDNSNLVLSDLSFELDSDGEVSPKTFYPLYWNSNLFSGVGYSSFTTSETQNLTEFENSRESLNIDSKNFEINFLSYKFIKDNYNFSIGISGEYIFIKKTDFGFINDEEGKLVTNGNGKNNIISFENLLDINVFKSNLYLDFSTKYKENLLFRISGTISPFSTVDISQETKFQPLISESGSYTNSETQDLTYNLLLEANYKPSQYFYLGFEYQYNFFPLKYDFKALSGNKTNGYHFAIATSDTETVTKSWLIKFVLNKSVSNGMKPYIGFGERDVEIKDVSSGSTTNDNSKIIRAGLEHRF